MCSWAAGRIATGDGAVGSAVLHGNAVHEHAMDGVVVGFQCGYVGAGELVERVVQSLPWQARVQTAEGSSKGIGEDDIFKSASQSIAASGATCPPETTVYPHARSQSSAASSTTDSLKPATR
jgi:hypothetical protein